SQAPDPPIFRRNQYEGVIDGRWYLLCIIKDESTGQLKVVKSRKDGYQQSKGHCGGQNRHQAT
ncbi:hypothetical protein QBC36DRAFT_355703, partial [Triangularia setosa]